MAKGKGERAADTDVWWEGLRWIEGVWMQAERFETVFYEFQSALFDARTRARCNASDSRGTAEKDDYDRDYRPFDPQRPIRVPTRVLGMQVQTDLDLLIVALRNVLRAQVRLPTALRTEMTGEHVLELLRNIAEHWDEVGGPSAEKLANSYPDFSADGIAFTNKEIWVGGLDDGVPLSRIRAWLVRVRQALVAALTSAGVKVPDDMDSMIAGDDALAWPPDRRRYALWSVPIIDMEDWPTRELPSEVAALMAERFLRLRERDSAD
jgi:hypothetical protein